MKMINKTETRKLVENLYRLGNSMNSISALQWGELGWCAGYEDGRLWLRRNAETLVFSEKMSIVATSL